MATPLHIVTISDILNLVNPKQGDEMEENNNGNTEQEKKPHVYGADMARAAFDAMDKEKERENVISSDADAFLDECEKAHRNPIEVVKFLAGRNGIELSGKRPEELGTGDMYDVLREVVDMVVEDIFDADGEDDESQDDEDPEVSANSRPTLPSRTVRPARKSVIVEYAFSW